MLVCSYIHVLPCDLHVCLQASSAATAEDPCLDLSQLDVAAVMFDSAEPSSFRHAVQVRQAMPGQAQHRGSLGFVGLVAHGPCRRDMAWLSHCEAACSLVIARGTRV